MSKPIYATKIAHVEVDECRIERIHVVKLDQEEIRFSWWPNGRFVPQALDVTESHLLDLMAAAIKDGVFTPAFVAGLRKLLEGK
jgi:hypothetical protein